MAAFGFGPAASTANFSLGQVLSGQAVVDHSPQQTQSEAFSSTATATGRHQHQTNGGGFDSFASVLDEVLKAEKEKWAALPPVRKNFFVEHADVTALDELDVAELRKYKNNINVAEMFEGANRAESLPRPIYQFEHSFSQYPDLLASMRENGLETPTPIQCQMWPVLMSGRDCVGIAQTGTGKTLAFLLPALIHIDGQITPRSRRKGPTCLILTPTRELAIQISAEVVKYQYKGIQSVCTYGGADRNEQVIKLARGPEIVIATPGRLNDLVATRVIQVTDISFLVLDEADRMLDLGFEPQIRSVLSHVRPDRQTVMTRLGNATWPSIVRELAAGYMKQPVRIVIGTLDLNACTTVTQQIVIVYEEEKRKKLFEFLHTLSNTDKCLVFVGRKGDADDIASELAYERIVAETMHGARDQTGREQALDDFRTGRVKLLIATDLASRGLDVADITHVVNYDLPKNLEEYVHRIGRTGRAGRTGIAVSLVTKRNWWQAGDLIELLNKNDQFVPTELQRMADRYSQRPPQPPRRPPFGQNRPGNDRRGDVAMGGF